MEGKIAIVTGAASGAGLAVSKLIVERGGRVALCDVDEAGVRKAAAAIGDGAIALRLDVGRESDWQDGVRETRDRLGGFNVLINNAAVASHQAIVDVTEEEWQRTFAVNALGPTLGCKHAVRAMAATGGVIVNISSNSTVVGMADLPLYSSSKGAVNTLTMSVAAYCKEKGLPIRCNAVQSGGIKGRMLRETFLKTTGFDIVEQADLPEVQAMLAGVAEPEEIARVILFLASDESSRINGTEIIADGMQTRKFVPGMV